MRVSKFWGVLYYVPFNINERSQLSEFKERLKEEKIDEEKLEQPNYIKDNKASLRKIYKSIKGKDKGNTTNINMNSLQLLSFADRGKVYHCNEIYGYHHCYFNYNKCITHNINEHLCSCLYTGDTNLSNKNFGILSTEIYKTKFRHCMIMMMQIPHHGSKNNYEPNIIRDPRIMTGFTNFDPDYKIFDSKICVYFALNRKPLFLIAKEDSSQYQYLVFLES